MITAETVRDDLSARAGVVADTSQGFPVTIYRVQTAADPVMFAVLEDFALPRLSLRAEPALLQKLRHDYETVSPGHNLNRHDWNTIILTGQLSWDQIKDLIDHSYQLASGSFQPGPD